MSLIVSPILALIGLYIHRQRSIDVIAIAMSIAVILAFLVLNRIYANSYC